MLSADTLSLVVFWVLTIAFALGVAVASTAAAVDAYRWLRSRWIVLDAMWLMRRDRRAR